MKRALVMAVVFSGCVFPVTGNNRYRCNSPADCALIPNTTCGATGFCDHPDAGGAGSSSSSSSSRGRSSSSRAGSSSSSLASSESASSSSGAASSASRASSSASSAPSSEMPVPTNEENLRVFIAEYDDAKCAFGARCGADAGWEFATAADCMRRNRVYEERSRNSTYVDTAARLAQAFQLDVSRASECIDDIRNLPCTEPEPQPYSLRTEACLDAMLPLDPGAYGETCREGYRDCARNLGCAHEGACLRCRALLEEGASCGLETAPCRAGGCVNGTCGPAVPPGGSCMSGPCAGVVHCNPYTHLCQPGRRNGDNCANDTDCFFDALCSGGVDGGVCVGFLRDGELCPGTTPCREYCVQDPPGSGNGVCGTPVLSSEGSACEWDLCSVGFWGEYTQLGDGGATCACHAKKSPGESCATGYECASRFCDGTCTEGCTSSAQCVFARCVGGACVPDAPMCP